MNARLWRLTSAGCGERTRPELPRPVQREAPCPSRRAHLPGVECNSAWSGHDAMQATALHALANDGSGIVMGDRRGQHAIDVKVKLPGVGHLHVDWPPDVARGQELFGAGMADDISIGTSWYPRELH